MGEPAMQPMNLEETMLERTEIFKGKIFSVHVDKVRLPDGKESMREVVEHGGGVAVLPLDEQGNVLTVTQYRYILGRTLLEIPAGKLDPGEDPAAGALRELHEETGAVPDTLISLGHILPSPGCYTEVLHIYLAQNLHMEQQHLDPGEFLRVERIPFDEMVRRCMNGEIEDAKTVTAVLKTKIQLGL